MLLRLLALFIVVPLVELALLLYLAQVTGFWWTFGLVIVTGVAGTALARAQSWRVLRRIQAELAQGRMPSEALWDGMLILVAGAMLLTPGLLTDLLGLLLLIPWSRHALRRRLVAWCGRHFTIVNVSDHVVGGPSPGDDVIDSYAVQPGDSPSGPRD